MKVLLVKTSSLGDVIHALPAVTEAAQRLEALELTWVVEEDLADIVKMHPSVSRVIPVAIRRWRKSWWNSGAEVRHFATELRDTRYDAVVDSQGLVKSGLLTLPARGVIHGYNKRSARESLAAAFYRQNHNIDPNQHAVVRQKRLLAASLGYEVGPEIDYGISKGLRIEKDLLLLHGTTWSSKEWPLHFWQALADLVVKDGYRILLPAGSKDEKQTALTILGDRPGEVLFGKPLSELTEIIRTSAGAVSVDTGLGHLAGAMGVPLVALYGATDPMLTGATGDAIELIVSNHLPCIPCKKRTCGFRIKEYSSNIYPPCFEHATPERVWKALQLQIGVKGTRPG